MSGITEVLRRLDDELTLADQDFHNETKAGDGVIPIVGFSPSSMLKSWETGLGLTRQRAEALRKEIDRLKNELANTEAVILSIEAAGKPLAEYLKRSKQGMPPLQMPTSGASSPANPLLYPGQPAPPLDEVLETIKTKHSNIKSGD